MDISYYLVLSALLFATGAIGVLIRRSPLVILLCLELMLNAGNLALLAFSRSLADQQGQVLALVVMVVAVAVVYASTALHCMNESKSIDECTSDTLLYSFRMYCEYAVALM